jgi:hypothetical protein
LSGTVALMTGLGVGMSRTHDARPPDHYLRTIERRVAHQQALLKRMIVQGTPTQAAEDQLRKLQQTLTRLTEQRASDLQRTLRRQHA